MVLTGQRRAVNTPEREPAGQLLPVSAVCCFAGLETWSIASSTLRQL
jgi:hypothetical protein